MLVLSRHPSEAILIGDDIRITVIGPNRHGGVSIGIEAPRDLTILREELVAKPQQPSSLGSFTKKLVSSLPLKRK